MRLREAVALALDKEEILQMAFRGLGTIADQKNVRNSIWYVPLQERKKDLERARRLLAEAGFPNGLGFKALGERGREDELIVIQSQLKQAGMKMDLEILDFATYSARQRVGEFELISSGGGVESDPHVNLYGDNHSEGGDRRLNNQSGYSNPRVDQLLDEGKRITSFQTRYAIYKQVVETLHRELPEIPYVFTPYVYGIRPHVKGLEFLETSSRYNFAGGGLPMAWIAK
jgi:peptide/nickel transport system substrate-binding protein